MGLWNYQIVIERGFSGGEERCQNNPILTSNSMVGSWQLAVGVCWHILAYHFQFVLLHLTFSLLFVHWYSHNVTLRASFLPLIWLSQATS